MKPKILVLENRDDVRLGYANFLNSKGYEAIPAGNLAEGEAKLKEHLIHLALVDIRLIKDPDPNDLSGIEFCQKKMDACVPRIILSGITDWQVVRDILAPMDGKKRVAHTFFQKTERLETLVGEIERVLALEYEVIPEKRIAVLTSGGDAPGMNAAIWSILRTALARKVEVFAVYDGYEGLLQNRIEKLRWKSVTDTLTTGGTMLGAARCKAFREREGRRPAVENLLRKHISALIVIGGDGSMQGAKALADDVTEAKSTLHTVALPGTIDNDLSETISIGAASAVRAVMHEIDNMVAPARALRRVFVCEIMGRYSGFLTIEAGLCVGAEALLLPEDLVMVQPGYADRTDWQSHVDVDETVKRVLDAVAKVGEALEDTFASGKRHAFVLFSEGIRYLTTVNGREWINAAIVAERLEARIQRWTRAPKPDVRAQVIGYPMRGGSPSRSDMHLGITLGAAAVEEVLKGTTNMMVGWSDEKQSVKLTPFDEVVRLSNRAPAVKFEDRPQWKRTLELQRKLVAPLPR